MTLYYSICLQTAACATGLPPSYFPFNTLAHNILRTSHLGNLYSVTYTYLPYSPNPNPNLNLALTTDLQISIFWIKSQLLSPVNSLESDVCFQNWHKSDHAHSLVFPSAFSPQCGKINKNVNLQYCLEYTQIMQLSWYLYTIRTVRSTEQLI